MPPPSAMAVQQQLRRLVINRAANIAQKNSSYYPNSSNNSTRCFHTTPTFLTRRDTSTIDFAYMPELQSDNPPRQTEILRVPILPDNSTSPMRRTEAPESVIRPEIATVSANGTHIDSPSAMFEVVDNHAVELSPFDLTNKVTTAAATGAAAKVAEMGRERLEEPSVLQEIWDGLVNDIFGPKDKIAKV